MNEAVTMDQVLAAAESACTAFDGIPVEPVLVCDANGVREHESGEVVDRYERHGFAVIQVGPEPVTPDTLLALAEAFDLGEAFVPPLYRRNGSNPTSVSRISAASNVGTADATHPSFGRALGQELHCDGTLQSIGFIKASLLLCESPAAGGGHTTLFNASAAFVQLAAVDMPAAAALMSPGALVRQANINGSTELNVGPVFTLQDGELVCHYCVTDTDSWAVPDDVAAADLKHGVEFLRRAALPGSPLFAQLTLDAGQAIVFDNTRISHGRSPYRDSETARRCLYRSLHVRHPQRRCSAIAAGTAAS